MVLAANTEKDLLYETHWFENLMMRYCTSMFTASDSRLKVNARLNARFPPFRCRSSVSVLPLPLPLRISMPNGTEFSYVIFTEQRNFTTAERRNGNGRTATEWWNRALVGHPATAWVLGVPAPRALLSVWNLLYYLCGRLRLRPVSAPCVSARGDSAQFGTVKSFQRRQIPVQCISAR